MRILDIKTKHVVHQPVCFNRIWKNALQSREKKRLKRLSCQMLAINFDCNSAAINLCVRSGQQRNIRLRSAPAKLQDARNKQKERNARAAKLACASL